MPRSVTCVTAIAAVLRDGPYNQNDHDYSRSNAYSDGYEQDKGQGGYEMSHRPGYHNVGGYSGYVNVNGLKGQRSSDARAQLSQRGFVQKDDIEPRGGGHIRTFCRAASEQCIVVHTRDCYVYSIDSARQRNCR